MYQLTWQSQNKWRDFASNDSIPDGPADPSVTHAGMLFWEEHCVECSIPYCYNSCSLYVARADQKCARFAYGIYPNPQVQGLFNFGADILFRRWAKLESEWPIQPTLFPLDKLKRQSRQLQWMDTPTRTAIGLPQPTLAKRKLSGLNTYLQEQVVRRQYEAKEFHGEAPHALYIKFYYPGTEAQSLQLEIIQPEPVFRRSLSVQRGWNEHIIPYTDLACPSGNETSYIRLWIDQDAELRLIFTWLDLVKFADPIQPKIEPPNVEPAKKVKCIAWDLDNTLWDGVIGDAGAANVVPNPQVLDLIERLDERGILQTIASKNTYEIAWAKLEELGIEHYFLYPAIHWGPKSESLRNIATQLNINIDTFAFIDDSPFERDEVATAFPQVRIYDPGYIDDLLGSPEFDGSVTAESRTRRAKYQAEMVRQQISATWGDDHLSFLRSCNMVMKVTPPQEDQKKRCLELLQRSNQFNLSARRYSSTEFKALLRNPNYRCFAFDVRDKFGDYGIVGFMAWEIMGETHTLVDFVLSCRVAQKRVEETFIFWYARQLQKEGRQHLCARLHITDRNLPLRESLKAMNFNCIQQDGSEQLLELDFEDGIEDPEIIRIEAPMAEEMLAPEMKTGEMDLEKVLI